VEHKPEVMAIADHIVDMGPGAGTAGGTVVFEGPFKELKKSDTLTGKHLSKHQALKENRAQEKAIFSSRTRHSTISTTSQ